MKKKAPKKKSQLKAASTKRTKVTKKDFFEVISSRTPYWKFTKKQLEYRYWRLEFGLSQEAAALKAGYSAKYARKKAYKTDRVAKVGIAKELERAGFTDRWKARKLFDIANGAQKMQSCTVEVRDEGGNLTIQNDARVEVPDLHLQVHTIELVSKLQKQLSSQPQLPNLEDGIKLTVILDGDPNATRRVDVSVDGQANAGLSTLNKS